MTITDRILGASKTVAAVVIPLLTTAILQAVAELSTSSDTIVAAIATAIAVYLTPNKAPAT